MATQVMVVAEVMVARAEGGPSGFDGKVLVAPLMAVLVAPLMAVLVAPLMAVLEAKVDMLVRQTEARAVTAV